MRENGNEECPGIESWFRIYQQKDSMSGRLKIGELPSARMLSTRLRLPDAAFVYHLKPTPRM